MTFSLRILTLEEMDRAAVIQRTSFDVRLPWLAGLHTLEEDRTYFRERVFPNCQLWGAVSKEIVGIIAFRQEWIDQLYVLPQHQGQGMGCALLDIAKAVSGSLRLWTFQRNIAARGFYEARGFITVEETDGRHNEEREPDVLYRWKRHSALRASP
jgi:GNAT superfamily N-acetyltransferase